MKQTFETPELEVVVFKAEDIVCKSITSPQGEGGTETPDANIFNNMP